MTTDGSTNFAWELFNHDKGSCLIANECEKFGMTWGCKPYCPVFERGQCEQQEENRKLFENDSEI